MLKFRSKLIGSFIKVLALSLLATTAFTVIMCAGFVDGELLTNQRALMAMARELKERTDLQPMEIADSLSSSDYLLHPARVDELTEAERLAIENGESVVNGHFLGKRVFFLLGDAPMVVEAYPANTLLIWALLRSLFGNLILIMMGCLLVYILSRRMAQPIVNLMNATHQVAKGNFDINVDARMPRFTGGIKEIAELTDNFNRMAHELKNVDYLRRDFVSNLSHELKTPVASISGYARLLLCENLTEDERQEYARAIALESARLSSLSDNLLKLTRLESQAAPALGQKYKLDEQLRRSVAALHPQIERKGLTLSVELPRVTVAADETLLAQVWTNLLDNAIKFTPPGGSIAVTLTHGHGLARVTVADSGIGMTDEVRARIFEKFYQADHSRHMDGNGLGLSLVKRIVDLCHGTIEVESTVGQGSRFTVVLPEKERIAPIRDEPAARAI